MDRLYKIKHTAQMVHEFPTDTLTCYKQQLHIHLS